MAVSDTIITAIGGGGITGLLAYLGIRYSSHTSAKVAAAQVENDARKVDREQFQTFVEEYKQDQTELREQLESTNTRLRASILYIRALRREMYAAGLEPPQVPRELESTSDLW